VGRFLNPYFSLGVTGLLFLAFYLYEIPEEKATAHGIWYGPSFLPPLGWGKGTPSSTESLRKVSLCLKKCRPVSHRAPVKGIGK
jgi:hypothetical protein